MEPLPHVEQLVDKTRGARFFWKLDIESAYMQFRIREEDQFKTSFHVPGGQYEFRVGAFGLHGMSSILMQYMHSIFGCPVLSFWLSCPVLRCHWSGPARHLPAYARPLRAGVL
jgi:hypothetical protein